MVSDRERNFFMKVLFGIDNLSRDDWYEIKIWNYNAKNLKWKMEFLISVGFFEK